MRIITDPQKINNEIKRLKTKGKAIGLVPTMGALHRGHLSLIKQAARDNDKVVVSIFVNPAQFGPQEDLKKYPRSLKKDLELCRKANVDLVFSPAAKNMYPQGHSTFVDAGELGKQLCGLSRPGHFRGVVTIVAKLLNLVEPGVLYLGQKDAQQAIIIRKMINDLNFPVKVRIMPTLREKDGLALSSRNIYLNKAERKEARVLSEALSFAKLLIDNGQRNTARIIEKMKQLINRKKHAKIDYIAIVDLEKLQNLKKISKNCLIALAVRFGKTRLIDNLVCHSEGAKRPKNLGLFVRNFPEIASLRSQ